MPSHRVSPVFAILSTVNTVAGVESRLFFLNVGFTLFMVISLQIYLWAGAALFIHWMLAGVSRNDPNIRMVYLAYARQRDHYEPWPIPSRQTRELRPIGFGREGHF